MKKLYRYNTIGDFFKDVSSATDSKLFSGNELSSQRVDDDKEPWHGTKTWEEANELLISGDAKSAEMIRTSGQIRTPKRTNVNRPIPTCNVYGYLPHIPNYVAGIPTDMINHRSIVAKQKVITIIVAGAVNWTWSAQKLADVNAKVVTAIRMIEAGGVRCNLYSYYGAYEGKESVGALVKVKDSGRYLEIEKMAYAMVNPAFFRRHFFRFLETRKELTDRVWLSTYGRPARMGDCKEMLESEHVKWHFLCHIDELKDESPKDIKAMFERGN